LVANLPGVDAARAMVGDDAGLFVDRVGAEVRQVAGDGVLGLFRRGLGGGVPAARFVKLVITFSSAGPGFECISPLAFFECKDIHNHRRQAGTVMNRRARMAFSVRRRGVLAAVVVLLLAHDSWSEGSSYQLVEDFFKLPAGRKIGSTAGITVDRDGRSIWA